MIARLVNLNEGNKGWTKWSWWEDKRWEDYVACDNSCVKHWGSVWDCEDEPEWCKCEETLGSAEDNKRVTARWLKYMSELYSTVQFHKTNSVSSDNMSTENGLPPGAMQQPVLLGPDIISCPVVSMVSWWLGSHGNVTTVRDLVVRNFRSEDIFSVLSLVQTS